MQKAVTIMAVMAIISSATAAPALGIEPLAGAPETPAGLVVLEQTVVPAGFLTVYADAVPVDQSTKLDKRQCGSNNVACSGRYVPPSNVCQDLINTLQNTGGQSLPGSPRSICLGGNGGTCCVSWANRVSNANRGSLLDAARAVQGSCVLSGRSGLTRNTRIGSTCTTQCLSNRATGCTN